jgi:hypothetical protein
MLGGWSGPKNRRCCRAPLPRVLRMAPAAAGSASLGRSSRDRPRADRAGSAAAPNLDKPDSPRRSEDSLIELELVPKKAKTKAKSSRPPTWGGFRAHPLRRAASSDARRSSADPRDFRKADIGAATASRLHCRRRRCRPHFVLAIPCNNCFRRARSARRPEPIMRSEEARQGAVVQCLFGTESESA